MLTRSGTEQTRVLRAVNCWLESKRAAAACSNTAVQLQRPPLLQSPQLSAASLRCAQAPVPDQVAPPAPQHIGSAPILTTAAAAWIHQLQAPLNPSFQRQPLLLLSSPTTSALPAPCMLRSRTRTPLQPLRAPTQNARTLTAAPRPPRVVPTTRAAPASPHQDVSARALGSSSSSSSKPGSRCEELQQALEVELGSEHRLRPSQLTVGLERALARCRGIVLRERVAALRQVVGLEVAAAMVHSYPFLLLHVVPSDIPNRLAALTGAFGVEPKDSIGLVCGRPGAAAILKMVPAHAYAKVETLCAVLRVDQKVVFDICTQYPRVLTADHQGMRLRVAALGDALGLTTQQVADMCKRCPSCLSVDPNNAAEVCEAMAAALEVERSEAAQLCFNIPSLLSKQPAKVAEVASWLKQHLGLTCGDLDIYLVRYPALCIISASCAALSASRYLLPCRTTRLLNVLAILACSVISALAPFLAAAVLHPELCS
jgi:hypothetical protein